MRCMSDEKTTYTVWGIDKGAHEVDDVKPIATPTEQVALLKRKGVAFERCSEGRALEVLSGHEVYLHLTAYRVLFQRHADGPNAGKFVDLDFGDLVDVCALDDVLRETFRLMAKDIERVVKTWLVVETTLRGEDGYAIVADFVESLAEGYRSNLRRDLSRRSKDDEYAGTLIGHYRDKMPVWVLLEVIPFGTMLTFYLHCVDRWGEKERREVHYALKDVKAIRNCASHSGCLCNGFTPERNSDHATSGLVLDWLNDHGIKSTKGRRARLRNRRTQQLVTTVALHDLLVGAKADPATRAAIRDLRKTMVGCAKRYGTQNPLVSHLGFVAKVLDAAGL